MTVSVERPVFYNLFVPGKPFAMPRPRFAGHAYSKKPAFYNDVYWYAKSAVKRPFAPLDGPLRVDVEFVFPAVKSHTLYWHISVPDEDNLKKLVYDALTTAKWWVDDKLICSGSWGKRYAKPGSPPEPHGVHVKIERLTVMHHATDAQGRPCK